MASVPVPNLNLNSRSGGPLRLNQDVHTGDGGGFSVVYNEGAGAGSAVWPLVVVGLSAVAALWLVSRGS